MSEPSSPYAPSRGGFHEPGLAEAQRAGTATIFGQVMFLVGVAILFLALGTFIGRDLSPNVAMGCSLAGFVMLIVAAFGGQRFRVGGFAVGWLYALALLIGLGLGPTIAYFLAAEPGILTQAAGGTALTVIGMGALGLALSKDLASWMRPLSFVIFGLVGVSIVMLLFFGGGNPLLSLAIYAVSALLIMVDFNFIRKHGGEDDVVWLATGIFVSIVNIFISLLNLLSSR